jgi:hypothetical protein
LLVFDIWASAGVATRAIAATDAIRFFMCFLLKQNAPASRGLGAGVSHRRGCKVKWRSLTQSWRGNLPPGFGQR